METLKFFGFLILILSIVAGAFFAILSAADKASTNYCLELQKQATEFKPYNHVDQTGFFITKDDASMCYSRNIEVKAVVL